MALCAFILGGKVCAFQMIDMGWRWMKHVKNRRCLHSQLKSHWEFHIFFLGWVNTTGYMLNTLCGTICWKSLESCWTLSTTSIFNGKKWGSDLLEVLTIYKVYVSGLFFREYPQHSYGLKNATFTYLNFKYLNGPLIFAYIYTYIYMYISIIPYLYIH